MAVEPGGIAVNAAARMVVRSLAVFALAAACADAADAPAETPLGASAGQSGRYFGAALDPSLFGENSYSNLAAGELTSVTPENAMKWSEVEPARGSFDWRGADAVVAFAKAHGQKVRGHNLVWHSQLPAWLTAGGFSPAELRSLMVEHIAVEAGRYKGAVYAWDVVNEPFADGGGWRQSIWFDAMGPGYVATALRAARAADPGAKLYINEYGVETDGPKIRALLELVASLKREGAPIDGVGLQSHFVLGSVPADLSAVMQEFAALGVEVAVTELDVRIRLPATASDLEDQARDYAFVVGACRAAPACVGVTTWGLTDAHSWIPAFFNGFGAALPFDEDYRPKPAVGAMVRAFAKGP